MMTRMRGAARRVVRAGTRAGGRGWSWPAVVAGVFGVLLLALAVRVPWAPWVRVDVDITATLVRVSAGDDALAGALRWVSVVCAPTVWRVLAVVAAAWLWWRARGGRGVGARDPDLMRRLATFVLVTVEVGGLVARLAKEVVRRSRPLVDDPVASAAGFSFPSGHAFGVVVAATVVLVVTGALTGRTARPVWWGIAAVVIAGTGFARVGLGVHYLSDVVAGYLLGVAWALGLAAWFRLPVAGSRDRARSGSLVGG